MAKILLVHPVFLALNPDEQAAGSPYFPLGLLYLAGYVREKGHEVAIFDGTFEPDETAFARRLAQESADIVGLTALLPTREIALKLAQMARDTGAAVLFGGPDPTKAPAFYAAQPQVDIVAHHEGEQTLVALLDRVDAGTLAVNALHDELGVAFRNPNGEVIVNRPRPPISDLDTLPMPARDLVDMDRYLDTWRELNGYSSMTISTARGCPYGCEWCEDAVHGASYRQRSPESVAAEVKMLKEMYGIDRLRVVDDVDGFDEEWVQAWADSAESQDAVIPFEPLNNTQKKKLPMMQPQKSL